MTPSSFIPNDIKENFISGNSTIIQIHLDENTNNSANSSTIDEIKKLVSEDSI